MTQKRPRTSSTILGFQPGPRRSAWLAAPLTLAAACASLDSRSRVPALPCPVPSAVPADQWIEKDERHFARLWQVTFGGQNAEAYWSFAGDRLTFQFTSDDPKSPQHWPCDRIFVTDAAPGAGVPRQVSDGRGVTTCSYFMPGDREVLFASTQGARDDCPPKADHSKGYTWSLHPEFDLWVSDLAGSGQRKLTELWGYDAEATVSPLGDRIVFTSTRSGDVELWTADLAGGDLRQVTHRLGYDGGAFFSHDGRRLVFRSTEFGTNTRAADEARYRELLAQWKVRPQAMEIHVCDVDGSNRQQVTRLGGANFAPYFFPGDARIVFSTNHHEKEQRNFDLYAIDVDGGELERITTYAGFDSFPMFSPDGKFLVFASNRGGKVAGETNVFIAQWQP